MRVGSVCATVSELGRGGAEEVYLSMINVADGANVDVRLVPLEHRGIPSRRIVELCLAPGVQCLLHRTDATPGAHGAGGVKESASERHGRLLLYKSPTPDGNEGKTRCDKLGRCRMHTPRRCMREKMLCCVTLLYLYYGRLYRASWLQRCSSGCGERTPRGTT